MSATNSFFLLLPCILLLTTTGCNSQQNAPEKSNAASTGKTNGRAFREGKDYVVFERIRVLDKAGFDKPAEAFSLLLPKGWSHEGEIMWTAPGNSCAGTNQYFRATSPDGKYSFEIMPAFLWSWSFNAALRQMQQGLPTSKYCTYAQPIRLRCFSSHHQGTKARWLYFPRRRSLIGTTVTRSVMVSPFSF